jgi:hypothetical protein
MEDKEDGISKALADAAASIAAYTALIYVAGWIYHYSYFNAFEAGWLVSVLSPRAIISTGGVSLAALTLLIVGYLTGLFRRPPTTPPFYKSKFRIALVLIGAALLASGILVLAGDYGWAPVAYFSFPLFVLVYAAAAFSFAVSLRRSRADVQKQTVWAIGSVIFGIWLFPTSLGIAKGYTDRSKESSTLPRLELADPTTAGEYRALLITEERVYAVELANGLRVIPLTWEQVRAVSKMSR